MVDVMLFQDAHSLVAGGMIRHRIHIIDLINTHAQQAAHDDLELCVRILLIFPDDSVQFNLAFDRPLRKALNKGPLMGGQPLIAVQRIAHENIAVGSRPFMFRQNIQRDFSFCHPCRSFLFCNDDQFLLRRLPDSARRRSSCRIMDAALAT